MANRFTVKLRVLMAAKNVSQRELAERIGKSRYTVYKWLNDETQPRKKDLEKLAEALECSVEDFFVEDGHPAPGQPVQLKIRLPMLGRVAADHLSGKGATIESHEEFALNFNPKEHFVMPVVGRSMWPTCMEGDHVVARKKLLSLEPLADPEDWKDGKDWLALNDRIVIAELNDGGTCMVKRIHVTHRKDTGFKIILRSDNPAGRIYEVNKEDAIRIWGVVELILRDPRVVE